MEDLCGAQMLAGVYHKIQMPWGVDLERKVICYPWFEGQTFSALRLGQANGLKDLSNILFNAEMQRAEDTLRVYQATACQRQPDSAI